MYTSIAILSAGLAATASAFDCNGPYFSFYNRPGHSMSYQRLDPALFPGVESPHLHSFDGGNGLAASMDYDTAQGSTCTTARIKPDNSLYWRPTLFFNGNDTGFYKVPDKFLKIYYKFGDAGLVRANVTEFPEDFRMIAGDPFKRSDDGNNPGGIKWSCKQENYVSIDSVGFPKGFTSCKEGLATEITFPACWNGEKMDPKNPSAHMEYPTAGGEGLDACPEGFKVSRFPTIFIEFWYDVSSFDGQYGENDSPWVLANGDPTGFGWHADFYNGWEKGVLAKATAETDYCNCGCGCGTKQMKICFGEDQVNDESDDAWMSCSAAKDSFPVAESFPLQKLPGCNPLQSGPERATQAAGEGCLSVPETSAAPSKASSTSAAMSRTSSVKASSTSAAMSKASSDKATSTAAASTSSLGAIEAAVSSILPDSGAMPTGDYENAPTDTPTFAFIPASSFIYESSSAPAASFSMDPYPTAPASSASTTAAPYQNTTASALPTTGVSINGTLGLIFSDEATNPPSSVLATLTQLPTGCGEVVYETITNTATVTVTASAGPYGNATAPVEDTTTRVTQEATTTVFVTVEPTQSGGGYAYMPPSYKRHAHLHARGHRH